MPHHPSVPPEFLDTAAWFGPPDRGLRDLALLRRRRCVPYHRFSKLGESPDSIERQSERTTRYAKERGMIVVRQYDEPRASGAYLDNREVLQRLIAEIDELNVGVVVIESTDRLGRGIAVLGELWGKLEDRGIEIHDASAGVRIDAIRYAITSGLAEADRKRIIFNLDSGKKRVAVAGKPIMGRCLGYRFRLDEANRRVREIDPDEARTVQEVFQLYLDGVSIGGIVRLLNAEGPKGRHGRRWYHGHIAGSRDKPRGILRRLRYTGVQTWKACSTPMRSNGRRANPVWRPVSEWILSPIVPELQIVSPADFMAVQRKLALADDAYEERCRTGRRRDPYWARPRARLLSGLVRCGQCGARMYLRKYGAEGASLKCGATDRGLARCTPSSFSLHWVESSVSALLGQELADRDGARAFIEDYNRRIGQRAADDTTKRKEISQRLKHIDAAIDATFDDAMIRGLADDRVFAKRMSLQAEEEQLKASLSEIERAGTEPVRLRSDGFGVLQHAFGRVIEGGPIDTSIPEGAQLIAVMRSCVKAIRLCSQPGDSLQVSIELRPEAFVTPRPSDARPIALEGSFSRPPRNSKVIARRGAELEEILKEGRHRITDVHWAELRHLLPRHFRFKDAKRVVSGRTAVEAAIFHLQTGAVISRMPSSDPAYVGRAVRALYAKGWWRAFEPALRALDSEILREAKASKQFPVGQTPLPGSGARMTLSARVKSGHYCLSDAEWKAVADLLPVETLLEARLPHLAPRQLVEAAAFLATEEAYPYLLPRRLGIRADLEKGIALLLAESLWERVSERLKESFPDRWAGVDAGRLKRYYCRERAYRIGGKLFPAAEVADKLERIQTAIAAGVPSRQAAADEAMNYQTYIRWRTNPVLRKLMK